MYRRRNQKQVQNDQPVEKKEQPKKEEPVIKYVVQQRGAAVSGLGTVPMLNTLRDINYLDLKAGYSVPKKFVVDTLLSSGYLNADFSFYNTKTSDQTTYATDDGDWDTLYDVTTSYTRSVFAPGDLIMFETDRTGSNEGNLTVGFLIDTVYKAGSNGTFEVDSKLNYAPPKKLEGEGEETNNFDVVISSVTATNGVVYMFKANAKLEDIKAHLSYSGDNFQDYDHLRKLEPTNMSQSAGVNSAYYDPSTNPYGSKPVSPNHKGENDQFIPSVSPTVSTATEQFNLSSGAVVDGWIIYMYSSANLSGSEVAVTKDNVAKITGDVIRAEKVTITTLGNKLLNIGNTFQIPYGSTSVQYNGNSLKFASEPLNSVQYQKKYGDTVGAKTLSAKSVVIYTLKKCIDEHQPEE